MITPPTDERLAELRERCTADVWIGITQQEARGLLARMYDSRAREHALGEEVEGLRAEVERLRAAEARLARAEQVMHRALSEVEHDEVVYLLNRYLSEQLVAGSPS